MDVDARMDDAPQGWKEYIGIARTENTTGTVPDLEVFVAEFLPNHDGCVPLSNQCQKVSVYDPILEKTDCCKVHHRKTVMATFMGGQNELIPCVVIGERVRVLVFNGWEAIYWKPLGRDPGLRLHEHLRWYAMSQPSSVHGGEPVVNHTNCGKTYNKVKDTNSYWIDINTNPGQKGIHMHTSIIDNECCGYDMEFKTDPGHCYFKLYDTKGNYLFLDPHIPLWRMENFSGSFMELRAEDITISCPGNMLLNADTTMKETTPDHTRIANKQTNIGDTITENMSASIDTTTPAYTITGSSTVNVNGGDIKIAGGALTYDGNHTFSGGSFNVSTGSGFVPVVIIIGSNSW